MFKVGFFIYRYTGIAGRGGVRALYTNCKDVTSGKYSYEDVFCKRFI
jgi:hypothetical protein